MKPSSSLRVRVKICGITNGDDAILCVDAGADAAGLVLHPGSPRNVDLEEAARIVQEIPPFVGRVGVFRDSPLELVAESVTRLSLDWVQLDGEENRAYCRALARQVGRARILKTFRIRPGFVPDTAMAGYDVQSVRLEIVRGGQGWAPSDPGPWTIARRAAQVRPGLLLGGDLTPSNLTRAIGEVRPYAVDVDAGVEREPGIKEPELVRAFVEKAMGCTEGDPMR